MESISYRVTKENVDEVRAYLNGFIPYPPEPDKKAYLSTPINEVPIYQKDGGFIFNYVDLMVVHDDYYKDIFPKDTTSLEDALEIKSGITKDNRGYFISDIDLYEYLSHVSCCMRMYGWHKAQNEEGVTPTFLEALQNMNYQREGSVNVLGTEMALTIEEIDKRLAMKSIEWITSTDIPQIGYIRSLHDASVCHQIKPEDSKNCFLVDSSQVPLVASLPKAFQRYLTSESEGGGEFTGELGEKHEQTIKLESRRTTQFSDMYKFSNDEGDELVWFTSSNTDMEEGGTYRCTFKIKDHSTFNGRKQTKINYVKVVT